MADLEHLPCEGRLRKGLLQPGRDGFGARCSSPGELPEPGFMPQCLTGGQGTTGISCNKTFRLGIRRNLATVRTTRQGHT